MDICVKKGLDIPMKGQPVGEVVSLAEPKEISLNLSPFDHVKFRLLVKVGDTVKKGQPLAENKSFEGSFFVSPAGGVVKDIRRGLKRRLLDIIIEVSNPEEEEEYPPMDLKSVSNEELIAFFKKVGAFSLIRSRPFDRLANPEKAPRAIFVKACETAPLTVSQEMQVAGHERDFEMGLEALARLTRGVVNLVYKKNTTYAPFLKAIHCVRHTVDGPHPAGNASVHIEKISPIRSSDECVWTLTARDVVVIGHWLRTGRYLVDLVVSVAGPGVIEGKAGFVKTRLGTPIASLLKGRVGSGSYRFISGNPLMGHKVEESDFLGFYDTVFCVIPENQSRQLLHFFRLGSDKFTASRAYVSGLRGGQTHDFTTNQHGEHRAFIDGTLYDKVQPLQVPTMQLVKSVMAGDFDEAEDLGLLEVAPEDFALPTFVCPSKIEMTEIIKEGLTLYAKEVFGDV